MNSQFRSMFYNGVNNRIKEKEKEIKILLEGHAIRKIEINFNISIQLILMNNCYLIISKDNSDFQDEEKEEIYLKDCKIYDQSNCEIKIIFNNIKEYSIQFQTDNDKNKWLNQIFSTISNSKTYNAKTKKLQTTINQPAQMCNQFHLNPLASNLIGSNRNYSSQRNQKDNFNSFSQDNSKMENHNLNKIQRQQSSISPNRKNTDMTINQDDDFLSITNEKDQDTSEIDIINYFENYDKIEYFNQDDIQQEKRLIRNFILNKQYYTVECSMNTISKYYTLNEYIKSQDPNMNIKCITGQFFNKLTIQFSQFHSNKQQEGKRYIKQLNNNINEIDEINQIQVVDIIEDVKTVQTQIKYKYRNNISISTYDISPSSLTTNKINNLKCLIKQCKILDKVRKEQPLEYDITKCSSCFNSQFEKIKVEYTSNIIEVFNHQIEDPEIENLRKKSMVSHNIEIVDPDYELYEKQNGLYYRNEQGKLVYTNEQLVEAQRTVFKSVLKKVGSSLLKGESPFNISLPVNIFGKDTMLQKVAIDCRMMPGLVAHQNTFATNAVEQIATIIAYNVGINMLNLEQTKPFNPIWGESFNCKICEQDVSVEQVLHHPPISNFQMSNQDKSIEFYGQKNILANVMINTAQGTDAGKSWFKIHGKTQQRDKFPQHVLNNFNLGQRQVTKEQQVRIQCECDLMMGIVFFDPQKINSGWFAKGEADSVEGAILSNVNPTEYHHYSNLATLHQLRRTIMPHHRIAATIEGKWTERLQIRIDEVKKILLDIETEFASVPKMNIDIKKLPSDSTYRPDVHALMANDLNESERLKVELEELQRRDRKLRVDQTQNKK